MDDMYYVQTVNNAFFILSQRELLPTFLKARYFSFINQINIFNYLKKLNTNLYTNRYCAHGVGLYADYTENPGSSNNSNFLFNFATPRIHIYSNIRHGKH
jgi:hypothetical protein